MNLATATYNEGCGNRFIAVKLLDLISYLGGHIFTDGLQKLPNLCCGNGVLQAHNILVGNFFLYGGINLDLLRNSKLHQVLVHNGLGQLVASQGDHAVGDDAAVASHANIGGAGTNIHKGDVEHAEVFWNGHVDCGNRLQGEICHMKTSALNRRIKAIDYILWQEGHDDILANFGGFVPFKAREQFAIEVIANNRVAHTVELVAIVAALAKLLLSRIYAQ